MKIAFNYLKALEYRMVKLEKEEYEVAEEERSKNNRFASKSVLIKRLFDESKLRFKMNKEDKPLVNQVNLHFNFLE
jgi:hypothetical protein